MPSKPRSAASPSFTLVSVPAPSLSSVNILYIGAGFVGACSAAVSADSGHRTLVYDIDESRVGKLGSRDRDTIEACLFEEGLGDLLVRNRERIDFTADYRRVEAFLDSCDAVFMCLPTPEIGESGASDLSYYNAAAELLARSLAKRNKGRQTHDVVLVNKSTVPIAMADRTPRSCASAACAISASSPTPSSWSRARPSPARSSPTGSSSGPGASATSPSCAASTSGSSRRPASSTSRSTPRRRPPESFWPISSFSTSWPSASTSSAGPVRPSPTCTSKTSAASSPTTRASAPGAFTTASMPAVPA